MKQAITMVEFYLAGDCVESLLKEECNTPEQKIARKNAIAETLEVSPSLIWIGERTINIELPIPMYDVPQKDGIFYLEPVTIPSSIL